VVLALASADHAVALVRDADDEVIGMITPVELQRAMTGVEGALRAPARDVMSRHVPTVEGETSVMLAEQRMETEDLAALLVLGADGRPIGLLPRPRRR
jgi:predicted transcriptional regulator